MAHLAPDFAHASLKGSSFKWTAGSSCSLPPGSPECLSLISVPCFSKFPLCRLCLQQSCHETEVATAEELLTKTGTNSQCALAGASILHGVCHETTCVKSGSQFRATSWSLLRRVEAHSDELLLLVAPFIRLPPAILRLAKLPGRPLLQWHTLIVCMQLEGCSCVRCKTCTAPAWSLCTIKGWAVADSQEAYLSD